MSVDNVQGNLLTAAEYKLLTEEQKLQYAVGSEKERQALTIQFRSEQSKAADETKGTKVEKNPEQVQLTPEQQAAKAKRHEDALAELKRIKEMSAGDRALADQAAMDVGKEGRALYKHKSIRKRLEKNLQTKVNEATKGSRQDALEGAKTDKEKEKINKFYDTLNKAAAKAKTEEMRIQDRIEHTTVYETKDDKKLHEDVAKKADPDARLEVLNKHLRSENNEVIKATMENRGVTAGEAFLLRQDGHAGSDNTYQPTEVKGLTNELGLHKKDGKVRNALKASGFDVDNDLAKNIGKALGAAAIGTAAGAALPISVKAVAEAFASVTNSLTGEVLASDHARAEKSGNIHSVGAAAIAAGTTAVLSAAMFGDTKDENILRETNIRELFKQDPDTGKPAFETMTFGDDKNTEKIKTILTELNKVDLPYEGKTQILLDAAGNRSSERLSKEELLNAYVNTVLNPPKKEEPVKEVKKVDEPKPVDPPKREFVAEVHGGEIKDVPVETGLKHKAGRLYGDNIAREGYTRADGKPLTEKQVKELINDIYTRNNVRRKTKNGTRYIAPGTWALGNQLTLKDGTVVNLKPLEELEKIAAPLTEPDSRVGFDKNKTKIKTERHVNDSGYVISEKKDGGNVEIERKDGIKGGRLEAQRQADARKAQIEAEANKPKK